MKGYIVINDWNMYQAYIEDEYGDTVSVIIAETPAECYKFFKEHGLHDYEWEVIPENE